MDAALCFKKEIDTLKKIVFLPLFLLIMTIAWILKVTRIAPKHFDEFRAARKIGKAIRKDEKNKYEEAAHFYQNALDISTSGVCAETAAKRLGELYENGLGVQKDLDKAEEYYLIAGDRGDGWKLHELAIRSYTDKYRE
ncbi:MAG: hypothetical protein KZQ90_16830 [Candidatus Thiodiazotropha sp. (ex Codakia rugifera)]|nr:hypothetical protein [Candidatus Thiodiazotropha sp. (ex Codakia rugifera)]